MVAKNENKVLHFWIWSCFFAHSWQHLSTDDVVWVRHQHVQTEGQQLHTKPFGLSQFSIKPHSFETKLLILILFVLCFIINQLIWIYLKSCWLLNTRTRLRRDSSKCLPKCNSRKKSRRQSVQFISYQENNNKAINDLILSLKDDPKAQRNLLVQITNTVHL